MSGNPVHHLIQTLSDLLDAFERCHGADTAAELQEPKRNARAVVGAIRGRYKTSEGIVRGLADDTHKWLIAHQLDGDEYGRLVEHASELVEQLQREQPIGARGTGGTKLVPVRQRQEQLIEAGRQAVGRLKAMMSRAGDPYGEEEMQETPTPRSFPDPRYTAACWFPTLRKAENKRGTGRVLSASEVGSLNLCITDILNAYWGTHGEWPPEVDHACRLLADASEFTTTVSVPYLHAQNCWQRCRAPAAVTTNPDVYGAIRKRIQQLADLWPAEQRREQRQPWMDAVLHCLRLYGVFAELAKVDFGKKVDKATAEKLSETTQGAVASLTGLEGITKQFTADRLAEFGIATDGCTIAVLNAVAALRSIVAAVTKGGEWKPRHWAKAREEFLKLTALDVQQAEEGIRREFLKQGRGDESPSAKPADEAKVPPALRYCGSRSYAKGEATPVEVSIEQHNALQWFFKNPGTAQSTAAIYETGVTNVSRVMKQLAKKFPGTVVKNLGKGEGYFVHVVHVSTK